jgi:hypothetical protein
VRHHAYGAPQPALGMVVIVFGVSIAVVAVRLVVLVSVGPP